MNKVSKYKDLLKSDFSGALALIMFLIKRDVLAFLCIPENIVLKLKGCKIRGWSKFYGYPITLRYPNTTIEIGHHCEFVSSSLNNFRGVNHPCTLNTGSPGAEIVIGDYCGFSGVSIVADKSVKIGNHVTVGANTIIGDRDDHSNLYPIPPKSVIIDDDVWIGMHCIILKGVHIGKNTIIGAGSIVTKDIPANCIAAGIPCKVIKNRE